MTTVSNIFNEDDINYLMNSPVVISSKYLFTISDIALFSMQVKITDSIRTALQTQLGINDTYEALPMRWVRGNTAAHADTGFTPFTKSYLIYLMDNPGSLVVGEDNDAVSYPITANTAYIIDYGVTYKTENTGVALQLLVGPMSEIGAQLDFVVNSM